MIGASSSSQPLHQDPNHAYLVEVFRKEAADPQTRAVLKQEVTAQYKDQLYRLNNLYRIIDADGMEVPFRLNHAQKLLYLGLWYLNVVLKSRQHGVTTFACLFFLDVCLFTPNIHAAIIAHNREDAEAFFQEKIKFAYDRLPELIKYIAPATQSSARQLRFGNGSSIRVTTSGRSGTYQLVHICLSGDTEIYTKNAVIKPIKDIQPGDKVLTSKGSYRKVVKIIKNRLSDLGERLLEVDVFGYYSPLRLTENHKVLTRGKRGENVGEKYVWKKAGDLKNDDYLALPIREPSMKLRGGVLPFGDKKIPPSFDIGWISGFYLAEGTTRKRIVNGHEYLPTSVQFSIHENEARRLIKKISAISSYLGAPARKGTQTIHRYNFRGSKTVAITVNSKNLSQFLYDKFGCSDNKHIPDSVWNYGSVFIKGLIKGYIDGDGSYNDINTVQVTSTRRQLLDQLRLLLISMRYGVPTLYYQAGGRRYNRDCKDAWTLKLNGPGNMKFRETFGLPLPTTGKSRRAKYCAEHGRRYGARKLWRRGRHVYWMRVRGISECPPEKYVYDLVLDVEPHDYVTVNGVVHNSELGKIAAKYPEKAREIVTGTLNTVHPGNWIIIESTAEGKGGPFYDICNAARLIQQAGKSLTKMDYKFFFFPWYLNPLNRLDEKVPILDYQLKYFEELKLKHGIHLEPERKYWYVKKWNVQGDDMKREHPSTPEEAFEAAVKGIYYASAFRRLRKLGRITRVPHQPGAMVDTWWDIGMNDTTAIWFTQTIGREIHVINYYENSDEGLEFYVREVLNAWKEEKGYIYGSHNAPHDIEVREWGNGGKTRLESAKELGIKFNVGPKLSIESGIESVRKILAICWFDEANTTKKYAGHLVGLPSLEQYRKEWDEKTEAYKNRPLHNWASNGSDAFRTLAVMHPFNSATNISTTGGSFGAGGVRPGQSRPSPLGWT